MGEESPETLTVTFEKSKTYVMARTHIKKQLSIKRHLQQLSVAYAEQLHGKELSYNNINDADAVLSIVKEFTEPAVVAVKHMNPCGVGVGTNIHEAYTRAYEAIQYQSSAVLSHKS